MADQEVDPIALEEERLMRAMSRKGMGAKSPRVVVKKQEPTPAPKEEKKETTSPGAIPKWKQLQLEREAEERRRQEEEKKRKEEAARLIQARVQEFGLGADQEDEKIEQYLQSPRGQAEKPNVEKPTFVDPLEQKQATERAPVEDESYVRPIRFGYANSETSDPVFPFV